LIDDDANLLYQLDLQAEELCRLCVVWRRNIRALPGDEHGDAWGPSEKDLQAALLTEFNAHWTEEGEDRDSGSSDGSEDGDWQDVEDDMDGELVESMEAIAFTDEYRTGDAEQFLYIDIPDVEHTYTTPTGSPRKRNREA
jgi:hypothetical protein